MRATLFAFLTCFASSVAAENGQTPWSDLVDPAAQTYEDPFRDLTSDQISNLRTVADARERLKEAGEGLEGRDQIAAHLTEAENKLAATGIDTDWLLEQRWVIAERRKMAAVSGNKALDGEMITLAGYAIPAPPTEDGTAVAYLVPERGMCSHTPPPNPNQMVRVVLKSGWEPTAMHEPVQLTGRVTLTDTTHVFQVVDGMVPMRAAYEMVAMEALTLRDTQTSGVSQPENAWAAAIVDRLSASGQLESNGSADDDTP